MENKDQKKSDVSKGTKTILTVDAWNRIAKRDLPLFQCTKKVHAVKISEIYTNVNITSKNGDITHNNIVIYSVNSYSYIVISKEYYEKFKPYPGGYYVVYEDGYESFSPKEAFENGYFEIHKF